MTTKVFSILAASLISLAAFTVGCSAQVQTEDQALESLRQMTRGGKLPPESVVQSIETRFAGRRTGALAGLLRARIKFEAQDYAGAAAILDSKTFKDKTSLGDYALWLRGRSLQLAGRHAEAMKVFDDLNDDFRNSLRNTEANLLWADSAMATGNAAKVPGRLRDLVEKNNAEAMIKTARAYESAGDTRNAAAFYRKGYFFAAGTPSAKEAETRLTAMTESLSPQNGAEAAARADRLYKSKNYSDAVVAYNSLISGFPSGATPEIQLNRLTALAYLKRMPDARNTFDSIAAGSDAKRRGYYELAAGYARSRLWSDARSTLEEMRRNFPRDPLTAKAFVDVGLAARDAKSSADESYLLSTAVNSFSDAVEVAQAQFELAWMQHESGNFAQSSQMLTEHLARYVDKDTTNRGKAGYWAARDSERAGKVAEACALYAAVSYRYGANWYGYIADMRIGAMKGQGKCRSSTPPNDLIAKAAANLRGVTVAAETSTPREMERVEKSDQLSIVGLFDWALEELQDAKRTADNSPKINLALARYYRFKGDNVNALLALAKSYPDYSQMFPEEMGREEWDIFYPLTNWTQIKNWAQNRNLDKYQVAGLIRQESVFNPRAHSGANAYGLMQLLLPTARVVARKFGSTASLTSGESLYDPATNIELGTGYMRDQFDKFGRIEYVAVAYNAGPGRVPKWRATLPAEIDDFVEEIPFKETKGYVQGIIRNSAQYRRLYDDNGNFKPNVGTKPLRGEIDSKSRDELRAEFPDVIVDDSNGE